MASGTTSRSSSTSADGIAASGGPPTPEQGAEIQRLGAAIEKASKIDLLLLFLAVACMATARYWYGARQRERAGREAPGPPCCAFPPSRR